MKILFVTEFFPSGLELKFTGGVETRTFFITRFLAKTDKIIIVCRKTKHLQRQKKLANILIYPCGLPTFNIEANFFSVFERIIFIFAAILKGLSLDFDLVEGSNFVTYLPAFFLGLIKKKPRVATYHDVFQKRWLKNFGLLPGFFGEILETIILKLQWTKIIAVSKSTRRKLIKAGVSKKKINVVYGGVDYQKLKIKKRDSFGMQRLKIHIKNKNILCISRLVKYKMVDNLIVAFTGLIEKYPDMTLVIVGQGPEEKKLKKLVKEEGLSQKVEFLKNLERDKLLKLLKQSYIFCLPSVIEGFGLVTIEAAACQTPYVVSNIETNKEVTRNGQGGFLFKKKNITDLKEKIEILLQNKKIYQEKQKEGLILAKSYDWSKTTNQMSKVYHNTIK